jgi:predicted transcriptional regulator of viral defense system
MPSITDRDKALRLARRRQDVTARELTAAGMHRQVLSRLVASGEIERIARGLYRLPAHPLTEHHGFAIAGAAVPQGTVCLLSALQFHQIGTQFPSQVWIAIDRRARRPALKCPSLRIVRYTGAALTEGAETHRIEGQPVRGTASPRPWPTASSIATRSASMSRWRRCERPGASAGSQWTTWITTPRSAASSA